MPATLAKASRFSNVFHWTIFVAKDWSNRADGSGDICSGTIVQGMGARPRSAMRCCSVGDM
jgi:hypothetical protein